MPGTCFGIVTTSHTASRFWVPASVRSKPGALPGVPRCTRSAIGPLPGRSGAAASLSDQRNQPARDRWAIRNSSPACSPRYLPHRCAPTTVWPCSDVDRRVEGLQHRQRGDVDAADGQTDGVAPQMVDQRFDLGKFGHPTSLPIAVREVSNWGLPAAAAVPVPAPSPPALG